MLFPVVTCPFAPLICMQLLSVSSPAIGVLTTPSFPPLSLHFMAEYLSLPTQNLSYVITVTVVPRDCMRILCMYPPMPTQISLSLISLRGSPSRWLCTYAALEPNAVLFDHTPVHPLFVYILNNSARRFRMNIACIGERSWYEGCWSEGEDDTVE